MAHKLRPPAHKDLAKLLEQRLKQEIERLDVLRLYAAQARLANSHSKLDRTAEKLLEYTFSAPFLPSAEDELRVLNFVETQTEDLHSHISLLHEAIEKELLHKLQKKNKKKRRNSASNKQCNTWDAIVDTIAPLFVDPYTYRCPS